MTRDRGCRPVSVTADLRLQSPLSGGSYIPAPPRSNDTLAQPVHLPTMTGEAASEIRKRVQTLHLETVPDWSGSTFSVWAGDPNDVIGAVAVSAIRWLARHGGGSAGVLPWGSSPALDCAVGPLSVTHKRDAKRLRTAIRARVNLGGNDLPAALRAVADRTVALPSDTIPLIWVPTDGIETVTDATHHAVDALPAGSVHLVLIDPLHGCTENMEDEWRSVNFGSVTRIEDLSVRNVAATVAELCCAALGLKLDVAIKSSATDRPINA